MTELEALAMLLGSTRGQMNSYNADAAAVLIAEYEQHGGLHLEHRIDGADLYSRIRLHIEPIARPAWWTDGDTADGIA